MTPGESLGPYRLLARLAHGGMGEVWEAEGPKGKVALKVIPEFLTGDAALVDRLKREAEAIRRLDHPGVVKLIECGEDGGRVFLAMELLRGETLAERLDRASPLPIDEIEQLAASLSGTLAYLHSQGIIHRDLKPQNVFLTKEGAVKLIDLGVAKVLDEASLTVTGSHFGTPAYMSPESFRDSKNVTAASDIWSVGVILYQVATGHMPFLGTTAASIIAKIADTNVTPQSPTRIRTEIPDKLARLIESCLSRDPRRRLTAAQIAQDLTGYVPRSRGIPATSRNPRVLMRNLFILAALIALPYTIQQIVKTIRAGRPHTIRLKLTATEVPEVSSGSFPSVGQLPLTSAMTSYRFADRVTQIGIRLMTQDDIALHIDRNRDGDPFNDPGIAGAVARFPATRLRRTTRRAIWNDVDIENNGLRSTFHTDWEETDTGPSLLRLRHDFSWVGTFELEGTLYEAILRDYEPDGILTIADRWFVRRLGDQGRISSVNMRKVSESWIVDDRELQLAPLADGSAELQIRRAPGSAAEVALVTNGRAVALNLAARQGLRTSYFRARGIRLKDGRGDMPFGDNKLDIRVRLEYDTSAVLEVNGQTYRAGIDKRQMEEKRVRARFEGVELGHDGMRYDFILSMRSGEDSVQTVLQIHRNFVWIAHVTIDGRPFQIAVLDDQADGVPTVDDQWTILPPGDPRRISSDSVRSLSSPWIETDRELRLTPRPDGTVTAQVTRTDAQAPNPVPIEAAGTSVHLSMVMTAAPMIAEDNLDSKLVKVSDSQAQVKVAGRMVLLGITEEQSGRESIHFDLDRDGNPLNDVGHEADAHGIRESRWERLAFGDPRLSYRVLLMWDREGPSGAGVLVLHPAFVWRAPVLLLGRECEIVVWDNDINGLLSEGDRWLARTPDDRWVDIPAGPRSRAGLLRFSESQSVYGATISIEPTSDGRIRLHVSSS